MASASSSADRQLIGALRSGLAAAADQVKAAPMQAYMKSGMPFYGVQTPQQRRIYRTIFAEHPLLGFEVWQATVLSLWREARFREERYAAIELTGYRGYAPYQTLAILPMYEEMIVTGAWWDLVDPIASNRLGALLLRNVPHPMRAALLAWSRSPNLWKRRSAIICQIGFKQATDLDLLYACIEPNLEDKQFFIRKAIGWALRAYAWTDPAEIVRYVDENESRLSALSKREALKNIRPTATSIRSD